LLEINLLMNKIF